MIFGHIQALVDDARDGFDLGSQLLLDPFQVEAIIVSDEVDGKAQVSEAPWMTTPEVSGNNFSRNFHWDKILLVQTHQIFQYGEGTFLPVWGSQS